MPIDRFWFSPFSTDLERITGVELGVLRTVAEGWFIDYKRDVLPPRDIAKHLSAFANQHGGWLFFGVEEDKETMTAKAFPGIPTSTVPTARVQLREATSAHIVPEVFFSIKVIDGPVPALGLAADRSIIIVAVPESSNPPHIHSSGRIYRRVADHSDPKPETDRRVLDMLWSRRERVSRTLAELLTELPTLAKAETNPRAYVFFINDVDFSGRRTGVTFRAFRDIMAAKEDSAFTVSLRDAFPTSDGLIARDVERNDPFYETLTFRWWHNGNGRLSIPLDVISPHDGQFRFLDGKGPLLAELQRQGHKTWRIVDFSAFTAILSAAASKYIRLREHARLTEPFWAKVRLCNVWRITPFINLPSHLESIKQTGIPVVQDDSCYCPPGITPESMIRLDESHIDVSPIRALLTILPLAAQTLNGVGVSLDCLLNDEGTMSDVGIQEFTSALISCVPQQPLK